MSVEGWGKVNFNWAIDGPTKAAFYGCNTSRYPDGDGNKASFTTMLSAQANFKDVFVWVKLLIRPFTRMQEKPILK